MSAMPNAPTCPSGPGPVALIVGVPTCLLCGGGWGQVLPFGRSSFKPTWLDLLCISCTDLNLWLLHATYYPIPTRRKKYEKCIIIGRHAIILWWMGWVLMKWRLFIHNFCGNGRNFSCIWPKIGFGGFCFWVEFKSKTFFGNGFDILNAFHFRDFFG